MQSKYAAVAFRFLNRHKALFLILQDQTRRRASMEMTPEDCSLPDLTHFDDIQSSMHLRAYCCSNPSGTAYFHVRRTSRNDTPKDLPGSY